MSEKKIPKAPKIRVRRLKNIWRDIKFLKEELSKQPSNAGIEAVLGQLSDWVRRRAEGEGNDPVKKDLLKMDGERLILEMKKHC